MSIFLGWQSTGVIIQGEVTPEGLISFPVITPGVATAPLSLLFYLDPESTTPVNTLENIKIYLGGDVASVNIIQNIWPALGGSAREDLNGGLEISFDQGNSYTRFNSTVGLASNPASWIILPAGATSFSEIDGVMSNSDAAGILIHLIVPPGATQYQKLSFQIQVDCDVR